MKCSLTADVFIAFNGAEIDLIDLLYRFCRISGSALCCTNHLRLKGPSLTVQLNSTHEETK